MNFASIKTLNILIATLALVGLEIDVISNPFNPEFVMDRSVLLFQPGMSEGGPCRPLPVACDAAPSGDLKSHGRTALTIDVTVALPCCNGHRAGTAPPVALGPPPPRLAVAQACRGGCIDISSQTHSLLRPQIRRLLC